MQATLRVFGLSALLVLVLLSTTCSFAAGVPAGPAVVPVPAAQAAGVRLEVLTDKVREPVVLTFAPKDKAQRLFIVEKDGRIRVLLQGKLLPEAYLDVTGRTSRGSEQGLLGLVFHPGFMTNGRFFVNYTDKKGDTHIVEFTAPDPGANVAANARERELLKVDQPYSNHNGGHLLMLADGALLVGLGDGGSGGDPQGNGQNPTTLLSKMFRLETDPESRARPKILAKGLRNPWRYAIDAPTGDLYIADVGQNKWEEIHVTPLDELRGKNYGWNILEGSHCFRTPACGTTGLELPAVEYDHGAGCSITGGIVYRGKALPKLAGVYFYADYCTALLRSFRWNRTDRVATEHWDWKKALDPKERLAQISAFGEDEDGEMYILSLKGTIWKLVPAR